MEGMVRQGRSQICRDINKTKYLHNTDEIYYIYIVYVLTCTHLQTQREGVVQNGFRTPEYM